MNELASISCLWNARPRGLAGSSSAWSTSLVAAGFLVLALVIDEAAIEALVLALLRVVGARGSSSLVSGFGVGSGSGSRVFRLRARFGLGLASVECRT